MLTPLSDALTPLYYSKTCLNILRGTICDRSVILPQYIFYQLLLQISMTQILLTLVHLEKSMMISVCMIVLSHHLFFLKLWPKDFHPKIHGSSVAPMDVDLLCLLCYLAFINRHAMMYVNLTWYDSWVKYSLLLILVLNL